MKSTCIAASLLLIAATAGAVDVPVSMVDFAFSPDSITINPGDVVVWTNNGIYTHTSTSGVNGVPDGLWNSGDLGSGATYRHAFPVDGRFPYYCMHHYLSGMKGTVIVGTGGVGESGGAALTGSGIATSPNPFRSATTLAFGPAGSGRPRLRIYDASGQLVRSLDGARNRATWDGRDSQGREVPAGIYHCMTSAGSVVLSKLR